MESANHASSRYEGSPTFVIFGQAVGHCQTACAPSDDYKVILGDVRGLAACHDSLCAHQME